MKNLIFSLLIFSAAAAYAQEEVKPGAAVPAAAALKPPPQQNKYYPEILQTMKNLSVLLERWAEIPQPKMDALAPEIAAFNEKVKGTLGKEMLAEMARREKELDDKARSAYAMKTLQAFRAALQVYYGSNGGVYPKKPALLVPAELQEVPELYLPGHGLTAKITVIDSKKYDKGFGRAVTDSGGWLYFSDPESVNYGLLVLDCSHADAGGTEFFKY
ncbi:MAG: hypothetical protein Q7R35_02495 [Elusimicrobiota bacterium]|nr:hypothetical protein [Elusimicrobiota bacterium]